MANKKTTKDIKIGTSKSVEPTIDTKITLSDAPESNEESDVLTESFDDLENIDDALDNAIQESEQERDDRLKAMADKASKKRMEVREIKKDLGIKSPVKISQYPTRSHAFLSEKASDRAVHFILNQLETEIYKDGADIAPRILMGIPAYGKSCKKNAYEHLINIQEKLRDARGEDPTKAPNWIVITNDSSMITDRNLITRLEELQPNTKVAAPFGYNQIRASGKWYALEQGDVVRGSYTQCNLSDVSWNFVISPGFSEITKCRTLIASGPFIAVRGELFMKLDFKYMKDHSDSGYYHYMAHISLECEKQGFAVAQIKSTAIQFDDIKKHITERELQVDQSCFTSKWQEFIPRKMNSQPQQQPQPQRQQPTQQIRR